MYRSIDLSSKGKFDALKYNFKIKNVTQATLDKHKSKFFFERAAKKFGNETDALGYIFSNMLLGGKKWVGEYSDESFNIIMGYKEALEYKFTEDAKRYWLPDGYETLKSQMTKMIHAQEYNDITFFIIANHAMKNSLIDKLRNDFNPIIFDPFEKKVLTFSPLCIKYLSLENNMIGKLLTILLNTSTKELTHDT